MKTAKLEIVTEKGQLITILKREDVLLTNLLGSHNKNGILHKIKREKTLAFVLPQGFFEKDYQEFRRIFEKEIDEFRNSQ